VLFDLAAEDRAHLDALLAQVGQRLLKLLED